MASMPGVDRRGPSRQYMCVHTNPPFTNGELRRGKEDTKDGIKLVSIRAEVKSELDYLIKFKTV